MIDTSQIVVVAPPIALVWVTAIGVVVAAGSLLATTIDRIVHHARERLRAEVEAVESLGERFNKLDKRRNTVSLNDQEALDRLMKDYWSLQIDQWLLFYRKVISEDVYVTWLIHVVDHMRGRVARLPPDLTKGSWIAFGRSIARNDLRFRLIMEAANKKAEAIGHDDDLCVDEIVEIRESLLVLARSCQTAKHDQIVELLHREIGVGAA